MGSNMRKYLALVEWHLQSLDEKTRSRIMKDIRYDMELRKLREGLTEDELVLAMETPRQLAQKYGGVDIPTDVDVLHAEEKRAGKVKEAYDKVQDTRGFPLLRTIVGVLTFMLAVRIIPFIFGMIPTFFGILFALAFAFFGGFVMLPIVFSLIAIPFRIMGAILRALFRPMFW